MNVDVKFYQYWTSIGEIFCCCELNSGGVYPVTAIVSFIFNDKLSSSIHISHFPFYNHMKNFFFCIIIVFISLFVVVVVVCVNHLSYDWFVHNSTKYCICNQVLYTTSMMIDSTMFYLFLIAIEKYQTWDTKLLFFSFRLLSLLLLLSYNLIFKTIIMELGWKTNVTLLLLFKLSFETRWNDTIFATFN